MFLNPLKPTLIANMFESRARIVCLFFYKQFSRGLKKKSIGSIRTTRLSQAVRRLPFRQSLKQARLQSTPRTQTGIHSAIHANQSVVINNRTWNFLDLSEIFQQTLQSKL